MVRQCLISNSIAYGSGLYGTGYYGGFSEVKIEDTWKFSKSINSLKQFTFTIISNPDNITIQKGLEVIFLIDAVVAFKGIISNIQLYETMPGYLYYDIVCCTFDKLLQKRKIAKIFTATNAGDIIKWTINNILYEEGITIGTIQDGPTFDTVVFNYSTCEEAFNKIQTSSPGYNWSIDFDKKINFVAKNTIKSIYTIDNTFIHSGFKPDITLDEYRNIQYIEGGVSETSQQIDYYPTPAPDGISRDFIVKFPISKQPEIYISLGGGPFVQVSSTDIGTNYDTGKKWYWSYGSDKITQDQGEAVLTAADNIKITYYGLRDIRLQYNDNAEIASRAIIDGNSGKYEEIIQNKDITTAAAAVDYAKGLISKYKDQKPINLILEHSIYDFNINMMVKVEKPLFGINDWYLIESISAQQSNAEKVLYQIKLLSGDMVGGWDDYFKQLLTQQTEIKETDTLIIFQSDNDIWTWNGTYNIDSIEILTPAIDLFPALDLYPGTLEGSEIIND